MTAEELVEEAGFLVGYFIEEAKSGGTMFEYCRDFYDHYKEYKKANGQEEA